MPPIPSFGPIDTHAHVFHRNLPMAAVRRHTPDYDCLLTDYLALLDVHELAGGVLVQPSFLGTDNRYLLDALRAASGRLRGVVVVAPNVAQAKLMNMAQAGVTGIRLNWFGIDAPDLQQSDWRTLLARIDALGWHVELHVEAARLPHILPALTTIVARVVVDHFGRPDPALGVADPGFIWLLRQATSGQVWVKLAAAYRTWPTDACVNAANQAARSLLEAFGPQRLMWGSDWPHTEHRDRASYAATLDWFYAWFDDAATRHALLTETASDFFTFQGRRT